MKSSTNFGFQVIKVINEVSWKFIIEKKEVWQTGCKYIGYIHIQFDYYHIQRAFLGKKKKEKFILTIVRSSA